MSKTIDIKKVDSNFINKENIDESILYIDPKESDLVKVYGLYCKSILINKCTNPRLMWRSDRDLSLRHFYF